jgi:transmembrane sensor
MNPIIKAEDIEAAAAAWFERREWSEWNAEAEEALEGWLSESTAHRVAYLRLEAAWERAARLKALGAGLTTGEVPARASFGYAQEAPAMAQSASAHVASLDIHEKSWSGRVKWAMAAASLVAVLTVVGWYQSMARWQTYSTSMGTVAPVSLADGSRITLDSNTRIKVALDTDQRHIRLDQGEALFDVAKDPRRPMVVEVAGKRVTAIGTEFSVRRDSEEITVLVKEGRVKIEADRGQLVDANELEAGSKATTHKGEIAIEQVGLPEVERSLSWRDGFIEFKETPLPEAVAEFNRYSVKRIEIDDPSITSIRIGGRFRCTDTDAFLALLQRGFPVVVTRDGNRVALHRR